MTKDRRWRGDWGKLTEYNSRIPTSLASLPSQFLEATRRNRAPTNRFRSLYVTVLNPHHHTSKKSRTTTSQFHLTLSYLTKCEDKSEARTLCDVTNKTANDANPLTSLTILYDQTYEFVYFILYYIISSSVLTYTASIHSILTSPRHIKRQAVACLNNNRIPIPILAESESKAKTPSMHPRMPWC